MSPADELAATLREERNVALKEAAFSRLERERGRLERKVTEARSASEEERQRVGRLERKVPALEGELRLRA